MDICGPGTGPLEGTPMWRQDRPVAAPEGLPDYTASTLAEGSRYPAPEPSVSDYGYGIEQDAVEAVMEAAHGKIVPPPNPFLESATKPYDEAELRERFTPVPQDGASAGRILDLAKTAVTTDRSKTHGAKERSFELIAEFWGTYLEGRGDDPLSGRDVAIMMVLLKIARATQGTPVEDHFVDMAGYSAVAGELA